MGIGREADMDLRAAYTELHRVQSLDYWIGPSHAFKRYGTKRWVSKSFNITFDFFRLYPGFGFPRCITLVEEMNRCSRQGNRRGCSKHHREIQAQLSIKIFDFIAHFPIAVQR